MAFGFSLSKIFGKKAPPPEPVYREPLQISIDGKLSEEKNIENLRKALDSGADIDGKLWANQSALCHAASLGMEKVADFLIERGAAINPQDRQTPFNWAADHMQLNMMKHLVSRGADPKGLDSAKQDAMTVFLLAHPWERAKEPGFPELDRACMQYLLDQGLTMPEWGKERIYTERKDLASFVPELVDVKKFEEAGKAGDIATVRQMIADGMNPDLPAICGGVSPMDYAIRNDDVAQVRFLLNNGASVEQWSQYMTPIMRAAKEGAKGAFIELLRAGADTSKEYTADRYPDTTVVELAEQCEKTPGMKAFVEDAIAHRDSLPPPPPEADVPVVTAHKINVGHSLKLKPLAA